MKRTILIVFIVCTTRMIIISAADMPPREGGISATQTGPLQLRDPFWPVGYQAASESEQEVRTKIEELKALVRWPALPLRGITHVSGRKFIAVLEGVGLVESGDIVTLQRGELTYRWRIDKVTADGVTSTRLDVTKASGTKPAIEK